MNADAIRILEFPAVREMLAGFTSTPPGRELALALEPQDDLEGVKEALALAREMVEAWGHSFNTPVSGTEDVRQLVHHARAGGSPLEGMALRHVAFLCDAAQNVGRGLERLGETSPLLSDIGGAIPRLPEIVRGVRKSISAEGKVLDDASERLAELRARIRRLRRKIEDTLSTMIRSSAVAPYLQYPNPSIHRDRYVLAVNANHKHQVRGIVHGSSDSGATLYVEPTQTIEMGNELGAAEGAEQEEVAVILWKLTRHVAAENRQILAAQKMLAEVDLLVAKARMAQRYAMARPTITESKVLELHGARHPILLRLTEKSDEEEFAVKEPNFDAVVPLDVHLGDDFTVLVVTGPNTGGKTVALKTIGLICLMARAGLYVPAEKALVPVYDSIHADIGDEQSLQQSLSTFSSHMSRIIRVLGAASDRSLVLLDELGAGTDPLEGAALGQAILNDLVRRKCSAIVTTHLGKLKTYASSCAQAENACMEFDAPTLRPSFQLTIGAAGTSNALEIAGRLGMSEMLLDDARRVLNEASHGEYDSAVAQVRQAARDAEERRRRAEHLELEAEKMKGEYEQALRRIRDEEDRTGANIGLKNKADLEKLLAAAAELYDDLRFTHKPVAQKVRTLRDGMKAMLQRTEQLVAGRAPERPIEPGDEVYVTKVHKWGEVQRVDAGRGRATVQVAGMLMDVPLDELVPWGSEPRSREE